ncbi:MAG TPA: helix-turn-helix domain-containing protein [Candidatus Competibacter sp.]|nr:hypothetical protein [Candidatus Competibacteraceae bacterium]HRC72034.1 helix-turn-helix domain-containing protein [Candidatus Competibacter sp.]
MTTQQEIADHLGPNQSAISDALNAMGLVKREPEGLSPDDARKLLVRHYTDLTAGRGGIDIDRPPIESHVHEALNRLANSEPEADEG